MPLQKKFNNEKWSFYHNLSSPIKKLKKSQFWKILVKDLVGRFWNNVTLHIEDMTLHYYNQQKYLPAS
jgi:hypothetical protein